MTNEIKEILDIIKKVSKAEVNSYNGFIETPPMKWEIFLDYITNLQEENERLKEILHWKQIENNIFYKSRIDKAIEEKKIPEKLDYCEENTFMKQKETTYLSPKEKRLLDSNFKELGNKINSIIDYLKSKGE